VTQPLKIWSEAEGQLLRLRLSRPKANLVDAAMIAALDEARAGGNGGKWSSMPKGHFSLGASVAHLPIARPCWRLQPDAAHDDFRYVTRWRCGQCLGGGPGVALAGHGVRGSAPSASRK
jgi:cyclohexa-1,5-dienecarbonyl-CoA hydratase